MNEIYLDYVNGSPLLPEVFEGMAPFLANEFGNPQSLHTLGKKAKRAIEEARNEVAQLIGARSNEIFFTSSGSEGNNWVIRGVPSAYLKRGHHVLTSSTEHVSITKPLKNWEKHGGKVTYLPVDPVGRVAPEKVQEGILPQTVLITIHHAQSEIGTIQPIKEIVERIKDSGVLVHSDGVSLAGTQPLDVRELGVHYYTFSAQSVYGPKGVGALYIQTGMKIDRLIEGGNQEEGKRGGLENVPGIVGFGIAAKIARENLKKRQESFKALRDVLIQEIQKRIPDARLTGDPIHRLPYHASFHLKGIEGEALVLFLSANGVAAATGSSCLSGNLNSPSILTALGFPAARARGTLLLTIGWKTTLEEIRESVGIIQKGVEEIKRLSGH
ncbi:MAG: cysteine desulfurase [Nitrospirae bacterium]|nr:cysteine desulfurase [Nitrospirota bacterium]